MSIDNIAAEAVRDLTSGAKTASTVRSKATGREPVTDVVAAPSESTGTSEARALEHARVDDAPSRPFVPMSPDRLKSSSDAMWSLKTAGAAHDSEMHRTIADELPLALQSHVPWTSVDALVRFAGAQKASPTHSRTWTQLTANALKSGPYSEPEKVRLYGALGLASLGNPAVRTPPLLDALHTGMPATLKHADTYARKEALLGPMTLMLNDGKRPAVFTESVSTALPAFLRETPDAEATRVAADSHKLLQNGRIPEKHVTAVRSAVAETYARGITAAGAGVTRDSKAIAGFNDALQFAWQRPVGTAVDPATAHAFDELTAALTQLLPAVLERAHDADLVDAHHLLSRLLVAGDVPEDVRAATAPAVAASAHRAISPGETETAEKRAALGPKRALTLANTQRALLAGHIADPQQRTKTAEVIALNLQHALDRTDDPGTRKQLLSDAKDLNDRGAFGDLSAPVGRIITETTP